MLKIKIITVGKIKSKELKSVIAEYEKRQTEVFVKLPELIPVERSLSMTGAKIMSSALSHELTAETLAEIRSENERLRALKAKILTSNG